LLRNSYFRSRVNYDTYRYVICINNNNIRPLFAAWGTFRVLYRSFLLALLSPPIHWYTSLLHPLSLASTIRAHCRVSYIILYTLTYFEADHFKGDGDERQRGGEIEGEEWERERVRLGVGEREGKKSSDNMYIK